MQLQHEKLITKHAQFLTLQYLKELIYQQFQGNNLAFTTTSITNLKMRKKTRSSAYFMKSELLSYIPRPT